MSKTSLTEAGQTKASADNQNDLIGAINQVFALFRVNFHNQYYRAFPDDRILNQVKKLWFESLKPYDATTVLAATKKIIEQTEYLPTLNQMLNRCVQADANAPGPHQAYVEACRAASPKAAQKWSHPAIYEAGRRSDWFFLSTTAEQFAFPVFRTHYQDILNQINDGVVLEQPALADQTDIEESAPVSRREGLKNLSDLKKFLDL